MIGTLEKTWIRNASDELAVSNGCRFDESRGQHAVDWIERFCRLYEGEFAGEPMTLDDWQYDCTMRLFGWVKHSERWGRDIRRFRQAVIFIPKKNAKTPTLAAWALYCLIGDGEPGQKCFFAAKDSVQAGIATKHALEMLRQSPELSSQCTVNMTIRQITHEPTRSILRPLASSNSRTQEAQEGLNGSTFVDEVHVVDRAFVNRIKRAGISRSEPLHIEVSTAGTDPDGYGKERFDYAEKIILGEEKNEQLLAVIYAAPQDLSDADLADDPIKWGKLANPTWGRIIDQQEFLADYNTSKNNPRELREFKMYRLNIWQNASNPWLRIDDWMQGQRDFRLEDFRGRQCHSSIDLSSVRDFSSLCLGFDEGEEQIAEFWWYWLPEETYKAIRHLIDLDRWKADPRVNLMLTPGKRIDYGYIEATFRRLAEEYKILSLAFDDWNAEKTTQEIEEGVKDDKGSVLIPGTGVPRYNFSQSLKTMNEPTKQFEARVIDGKILHNGDPLTAWMIQNATIKPDANGNYKPLKPDKDSIKKIDGVITGVMTAAMVIQNPEETVYTPTRGLTIL